MDEEIKLVPVMDWEDNRPLYFRYIPGNILDVSPENDKGGNETTLHKITLTILDAGFFSEDNIRSLCQDKTEFLIRVPANRSFNYDLVEGSDHIEDANLSVVYRKRKMFINVAKLEYADHDVYVHTVLDPERREREYWRYLIKHRNDFNRFSVKRKGFMVLMSSVEIKKEGLISSYTTHDNS
ncbi:MAG: transposase [Candidatus Micrarchaeaceae archaeon]